MKKLIAMIGAVAMSFGLFADATPFFTSFDSGDAGVSGTEYTSSMAGWSGLTDPLTLKAYGTDDPKYVYTTTERREAFENENLQYLPLETERTNALNHAIGDGNIFVDQLVRFTGFEDPQTNLVDGVKIAVWMGEFFNDEETVAETNLYVTVGSDNIDGQIAVKLAGTYEINKWYRLTIKSLGDIFKAGEAAPRAGFSIWVDGVKKAIASDDDHFTGLISHTDQLKEAAASAYAKSQLFPAVSSGSDQIALSTFGYNGIGAIDDVYVDDVGPDFTVEEYTFTIADNDRVSVDSVYAGGQPLTPPYKVAPGTEVTITWEAKDGYKIRGAVTQTTTIDTPDQEVEVDDEQVEILDVVATVTNGQTVNKFAEDELYGMINNLVDGDVVTFLAYTSITDDEGNSVYDGIPENSTIAATIVGDLTSWVFTIADDYAWVTDCVGADANFIKTYVFEGEGSSVALDGDIAGVLTAPAISTEVALTVSGALTAESLDCGDVITLSGSGKVITTDDTLIEGGSIEVDDGDPEVVPGPAEGWFTYQIAAEPPPPAEKGFKVIISGVESEVDTLAEAFAQADDGTTITFLANVTDATGMTVDTKKTLTVDFAGFTYTVNKPGAGSPSTMTQAFQLLKGQTLTFKNGTIRASVDNLVLATVGKNIKRFFQSYANFTLEDMTLDGTNLYLNPTDNAMCEFANGTVAITGDTTILANKENLDAISIDTWKGKYPAGVNVTIDTTGTISSVKVWTEGTGDFTPGQVALEAGTITELKVDGNDADYAIAKSEDVTITTTPAGYFWDNGVLAKCAAEIDGTYYNTLAAAFTAAQADDEIVLLKDIKLEAPIAVDKKVTLNIGDFDITPKAAFTRPTGSKITIDAMFAVRYGGDFTVVGGEGVIDCSAFPTIYSPIKMTEYDETYDDSTKAKLTVNANLKGYYYAITGNGKRSGTEITINGGLLEGTLVDESAGIYHPQGGTLTINGGTIKGDTGLYIKAGDCICSVGSGAKIIATGTKKDYVAKKSGFQSTGDAFLIDNADYPGGEPSADIEGGEFVSANGAAVASYAKAGFDPIVGFVEGGTFTGAVKIDDAIAGGDYAFGPFTPGEPQTLVDAVAKVNDVNYATLAAAVAAAQDNDTVTLVKDSTETATTEIDKEITLDLNGKALTYTGCSGLCFTADGTVMNGTVNVVVENTDNKAIAIEFLDADGLVEDVAVNSGYAKYGVVASSNDDFGNKLVECENVDATGSGMLFYAESNAMTLDEDCTGTQTGAYAAGASFSPYYSGTLAAGWLGVLTVEGGEYTAEGRVVSAMSSPATILIEGGTFTGNFELVPVTDSYKEKFGRDHVVEISGGDFSDTEIPVEYIKPVEHKVAKWVASTIDGYVTPGYDWVQVKAIWVVDDVATTNLVDYNTVPVQPEDPVKTGYTFTGWQPTPGAAITEDTEYTAQFEIQKFTLTVPACEHATVTVKYGENPSTTDTTNGVYTLAYNTYYLVKYTADEGYELTGQVSANGNIQENTVLTGPTARAKKFYVQTFTNGVEYVQEIYTFGDQAISLTPPVLASDEEWDEKWYTDETYETQWTFDGTVAGNTQKAYAKITKKAPEYPSYIPTTDTDAQAKWNEWAKGKSLDDVEAETVKDAFLLNCNLNEVETEKAKFVIKSITKDASGNWVFTVVDGTHGDGDAYGNGYIQVVPYTGITVDNGQLFKAELVVSDPKKN